MFKTNNILLRYEYLWQDGKEFKKPTALSARNYHDRLFEWVESQLHDESIFPADTDTDFPKVYYTFKN